MNEPLQNEISLQLEERFLFNKKPGLFSFFVLPDINRVKEATAIIKRSEVPVAKKALSVMQSLSALRHLEIKKIGDDPVVEASTHLSIPLLLSAAQLDATETFGAFVLSRCERIPADMRDFFKKESELLGELQERANAGKDEAFDQALGRIITAQRSRFVDLCAVELCRQRGLDLERDFLEPLKLIEMNNCYDPHLPTIESRAASTNIPFPVRANSGRLRFAQLAKAQDSLTSALAQEFGHTFAVHAHFMNIIKNEVEKTFDVELDYNGKEFNLKKGHLEGDKIQGFIASNQLIQLFLKIIHYDYEDILMPKGTFPLFKLDKIIDLESFSDLAYKISILMVDPSINEALVGFPDIEDATTKGVIVPKGGLYHYNQMHLLLRLGIRDLKSLEQD